VEKNPTKSTDALWDWYRMLGVNLAIEEVPRNARKKEIPIITKKNEPIKIKAQAQQKEISLENISNRDDLYNSMMKVDCDLKKTANNFVFSDGALNARVMAIGEAPGAEEDFQAKPFVGVSGQLLDNIFASIGLLRSENLYIANIIPWRPPGNRQPTNAEIAMMMPYVKKHIEIMKPDILICVGGVSAKAIFDSKEGIMQMRGKLQELKFGSHTVSAIAMYHPAYLIRSPGQKAKAWQDALIIRKKCDELKISSMPF
jgi:uracil-DNA glycosylase family 4